MGQIVNLMIRVLLYSGAVTVSINVVHVMVIANSLYNSEIKKIRLVHFESIVIDQV